jgi:hypothetical protein
MRHPFPSLISARLARRFIGGLLLLLGVLGIAFALAELVLEARDMRFWLVIDRILVSIALSIVPIVVAIALFLRRMRGFATLLCLVGPLQVMAVFQGIGLNPIAFVALAYWFAIILLHWPERRAAAAAATERPDCPVETDWRGRVLVSFSDASVERAPDRFREIMLSFMALGGVTVVSYLILKLLPQPSGRAGWWTLLILWSAFWFTILLPVMLRLNRLVRQARARSAEDEILRPGSRQPILYLRSFELDQHIAEHRLTLREFLFAQPQATAEEILAKELRRCGPVIAIGRPGEHLPELGAARFYVSGERSRDKIADLVRVVQLVVVGTGATQGLAWELSHLIKNLPADRLVLWAHLTSSGWTRPTGKLNGRPFSAAWVGCSPSRCRSGSWRHASSISTPTSTRSRWSRAGGDGGADSVAHPGPCWRPKACPGPIWSCAPDGARRCSSRGPPLPSPCSRLAASLPMPIGSTGACEPNCKRWSH